MSVRVTGQAVFNNTFLILQGALDNLGIAYLPYDLVEVLIAEGRLVPVLKDWWPRSPGFHLFYANRRQSSPALSLVIEALRHRI